MSTAVKMPVRSETAMSNPEDDAQAESRLHRFSVKQYHRLIELGFFTHNDRVELLNGWIVDKMPFNPPHNGTVTRINRRLQRALPEEWLLQVQGAITLRTSEPEPDFAILRGPDEVYFQRKPTPRDIVLLIEVADSTLLSDRRDKSQVYAQARISEYWIVNLPESKVEVYTQPRGGRSPGYRLVREHGREDSVSLVVEGRELIRVSVRELLPTVKVS